MKTQSAKRAAAASRSDVAAILIDFVEADNPYGLDAGGSLLHPTTGDDTQPIC